MYGWDQQGLISRTDANGNSIFYLWDGLGNCIGIIDQDGRLAQSYEYSAFGECLSGKDAVNAFRYVGRYGGMQDDETGLTYFWNRWYDSKAGRWMSEDPIRQDGGLNLYQYVGNGPSSNLDLTGLLTLSDISIDEAVAHYAYGNGSALFLPLSAVTFENAKPRSFPSIKNYLAAKKDVSVKIFDEKVAYGTGKWEWILGSFTIWLEGRLDIAGNCWSFSGDYPYGYDRYDFDSKPWGTRKWYNELITRGIAGTLSGQDYDVFLQGPVSVSDGGSLQ